MNRLILVIVFLGFCILSNRYAHAQVTTNYVKAKKLCDSALMLPNTERNLDDESLYKERIDLLNRAIKIDSSYFEAYSDRFTFESELKKFNEAALTDEIIRNVGSDEEILLETIRKKN